MEIIGYGTSTKTRRARWLKIGGAVALLSIVAWLGFRYAKPAHTLYLQWRCLSHEFEPGTVAYTEDAQLASCLTSADARKYVGLGAIAEASTRVCRTAPPAWSQFAPNIEVRRYDDGPIPTDLDRHNVALFLHKRHTPAGNSYLVAVGLSLSDDKDRPAGPATRLALIAGVYELATIDQPPELRMSISHGQGDTAFQPGAITFFAGAVDPSDASRFVIPWEFNGVRKELIGRLTDVDAEGFGPSIDFTGAP